MAGGQAPCEVSRPPSKRTSSVSVVEPETHTTAADLAVKWLTPVGHERGRCQLRVTADGVMALAYPRRSAVVGVAEEVVPLPGEGRLRPRIEVIGGQRGPGRRPLHLVTSDPSS